jgi:DNA end-binding protein Ku
MMLYALRFAAEMRNARDYSTNTDASRPDVAQLNLARQLIEAYTQPFEIGRFKDQYEDALRELVEAKIHNLPAPQPAETRKSGKVIDLMEALRKSVAQTGATRSTLASHVNNHAGKGSDKKPSAPNSARPKRIGITKAISKKSKSA